MKRIIFLFAAVWFSVANTAFAQNISPASLHVAPKGGTYRLSVGWIPQPLPRSKALRPIPMDTYTYKSFTNYSAATIVLTAVRSSGTGLEFDAAFDANYGTEPLSGYFVIRYDKEKPSDGVISGWTQFVNDTVRFEQPVIQMPEVGPPPASPPDYDLSDTLTATVRNSGMDAFVKRTYTSAHRSANQADGSYAAVVDYYDALGFGIQQVQVGAASAGADLVTPRAYDFLWHDDAIGYLSYAASGTGGSFRLNALTAQEVYYKARYGTVPAYAVQEYEPSVRDKVIGTTAPGFTSAQRTVVSEDVETSFPRAVFRDGTVVVDGTYGADELLTVTSKDADKREVRRTSDRFGRLLREQGHCRIESLIGDVILVEENITASTYYVYDAQDRLRCIAPLVAAEDLGNLTPDDLAEYCFLYEYDARERVSRRKLPGCGWETYAYNDADLVVSRSFGDTTIITNYDALLRPLCDSLHVGGQRVFLSSYGYDSYDPAVQALVGIGTLAAADARVHGLPVWERIAVLDASPTASVLRAYAYDAKGRVIRTAESRPDGALLCCDTEYDFAGNVVASTQTCRRGTGTDSLTVTFSYDAWNRPVRETAVLNNRPAVVMEYSYDDRGRLVGRTFVDGLLSETFAHNIQGWQTEQQVAKGNVPIFGSTLRYYDPLYIRESYTGNITEWMWQQGESEPNTYFFRYDGLGRLQCSGLYTADIRTDACVESPLSYDLNGNITGLTRRSAGVVTDDLIYTYTGNRLTTLENKSISYHYAYDTHGNMTRDGMHGLDLVYNHLNLIEKVMRGDTIVAKYSYLSDGTKLSATDSVGNGLYYSGSLVYGKQDGALRLESCGFSGGRFVATVGGIEPHYFITDHLGSVRAVVNSSGEVLERNDYYPFGKRWDDGQLSDNRYRYNGKETQSFLNNPYTDYGARQYDPDAGIWHGMDKLSEMYTPVSPYAYCVNNPINAIDTDGRLIIFVGGFEPNRSAHYVAAIGASIMLGSSVSSQMKGSMMASTAPNRNFGTSDAYDWGGMDDLYKDTFDDQNALYTQGRTTGFSDASERYDKGLAAGRKLVQQILDGEVILSDEETIKLVGHSQGAAYAAGIAQALIDAGYQDRIAFVDYIAPHQPSGFSHPQGVLGRQFGSKWDFLSGFGRRIENVAKENRHAAWLGPLGHSISGDDLNEFLQKCISAGVPITVE